MISSIKDNQEHRCKGTTVGTDHYFVPLLVLSALTFLVLYMKYTLIFDLNSTCCCLSCC